MPIPTLLGVGLCDVQPPSHTLFFLTGMDRITALTLASQLCPWDLEEDEAIPRGCALFLPLPTEAEGTEGKCAELGLVCQQAGPQGTTSAGAFLDWEVPG